MKTTTLLLLALPALAAAAHTFQPAVSVVSVISIKNGLTTNQKKQQQQKQKQKQVNSSKPPKKGKVVSSAVVTTAVSRAQQVDVVQRSSVAAISCVTTWAMATRISGMNAMQASSLQGLMACAVAFALKVPGPVPFCAASFCGAVAGMSAHTGTSLGEASLLGLLCAVVFYIFERPNKKLQLGKGGRLGTIALLANVVYFAVRQPGKKQFATFLVDDIINRLRPSTTVAVVVAAIIMNMARSNLLAQQNQKQQASKGSKAVVAAPSTGVVAQKLLLTASKGVIIATLLIRLLETTNSGAMTAAAMKTSLVPLVKSTLAMFVASLAVQKSKPFIVLPVVLIGLVGATFLDKCCSLAAPLYAGSFIGMTSLPQFTTAPAKFLQASLIASLLLQLGLFAGFGGRLGFLAFVGVNFGL